MKIIVQELYLIMVKLMIKINTDLFLKKHHLKYIKMVTKVVKRIAQAILNQENLQSYYCKNKLKEKKDLKFAETQKTQPNYYL